jgi:DnaJ-class molecular chaperone
MFKLKFYSYGGLQIIQGINSINAKNLNITTTLQQMQGFKILRINNFTNKNNSRRNFSSKAKLDPYLILEVNRQADWKTIKQAYFRLARLYHPDMNKNDEVRKNFEKFGILYFFKNSFFLL